MAASHAMTSGTSATAGASTARGRSGPTQSVATGTPTRISPAPTPSRVRVLPVGDGPGSLEERLADVVATAPGRLGVAMRDDRGWSWCHDAERVSRSASTIKGPVLLAGLHQIEEGRLDLLDDVRLAAFGDRVGGSGPLSLLPS